MILLTQRAERNAVERAKDLAGLLSDENKAKAKAEFYNNLQFNNSSLNLIYTKIMGYLLQDIVVKEGMVVPKRVIEPDEESKKFLELYASIDLLDSCLANYREFSAKHSSDVSGLESKIQSAGERLLTLRLRLKEAERKLAGLDETCHESVKLRADIDKYEAELKVIGEQINRHKKRIDSLNNEMVNYLDNSTLRCYLEYAVSKAAALGLERDIKFNMPETKKEVEISVNPNLLAERLQGIPVEFIPYDPPNIRKPIKLAYKIGAIAAGPIIAAIIAYSLVKEPKKPGTVTFENVPVVDFNPQTMEVVYEVPKYGRIKQKFPASRIDIPSEKYLPGRIEIVKFDPKTMDITIRNAKHNEELTSNLGKDFKIGKQFIVITDYRQEGSDLFGIIETTTVYSTDETGGYGPMTENFPNNPSERKVPREEIMRHLRGIAHGYQTKPITQANAFVKDKMVIDVRYDPSRKVLTLITTQHGFDLEINTEKHVVLSGQDYDNIPEALIEAHGNHVYLDFSSKTGQVRAVEAGENFNSLLHFFPLSNLTPRFE
jgi:hypothetical protein